MNDLDLVSTVGSSAGARRLRDRGIGAGDDLRSDARALLALAQVNAAFAYSGLAPALARFALSRFESRAFSQVQPTARFALSISPHGTGDLTIESEAGRTRVRLRRRFVAPSGDPEWFLIAASSETADFVTFIDAHDPRLRFAVDAPGFGLASEQRGWVEVDGAFAERELGLAPSEARRRAAASLRDASELLHLSIDFGIVKGFFEKAATYLRNHSRPWDSTGLARATDDPHIVRQWGKFAAETNALARLYDEAVAEDDEGGLRASAIAVARSYASSLGPALVNGVIEILGASATGARHGFDQFWRDLVTHALDAPPSATLDDIGRRRLAQSNTAAPGGAPATPRPIQRSAARIISSADEALRAARDLAASWSKSAAEIDAERRISHDEARALELSGLLAITIPKEHGSTGLGNAVLTRVFRILARTDVALAQIPQNHFDFVDTLTSAEPATQQFFYAQVLGGARFGNAIAERGRRSRRDLATTITPDGDGYVINGEKAFCTGALTAAWVPVLAIHPDGRILTAYVERGAPGLDVRDDWDAFGQRATFSGTTVLRNVFAPAERVVDRGRGHAEFLLAQFAGNQLIHAAIEVGAGEGALDRASAIILSGEGSPSSRDLERLGSWEAQTQAARALVDRAADLVDQALEAVRPTREQAVSALIAVDEAKSLAYALGPAITGDLASFSGASRDRQGLDRLWRNSRTHALHDPVRWRQFYVGNYHLNGALAPDIASRFEVAERGT